MHLFAGPKEARGELPPPVELRTHIAVADALRHGAAPGWLWSHFPAGGHREEKTGALMKRMGMQRGWSDFLLIAPSGTHHWLELKRDRRSKLTVEQQAFATALMARGVPWSLAHSYDEAIHTLRMWGALRLRLT